VAAASRRILSQARSREPGRRSGDLEGLSEKQLANAIRAHRRGPGKSGLTVVAEAATASA